MRNNLVGGIVNEESQKSRKLHVSILKVALIAACAFLLCVARASAQGNTADILGTVTDTSGAVVPGAMVTLTNVGTNVSQAATTSSAGDYIFTLVQVGTYSISVKAMGFKAFVAANVAVSAGDRARVDAKMEVGNVQQTVEVQSLATPALQTDSAAVSTLVTEQAVQDVPLDGRNVVKLIQLSAGTTAGSPNSIASGQRPDDRRQTAAFSVNGQTDTANNFLIDGLDNNERVIGGIGVRPSVDAIQEANVDTNTYSAEAGRTAGGVVNIVTKSGTNSLHGSAFEFFRNKVLNANPNYRFPTDSPTDLTTALPKPPFRQNQYGGSLGGPIKKNKTFFFGDFERLTQAVGLVVPNLVVPTLCERGSKLLALQGYKGPAVTCPDGLTPVNPGDFSDSPSISPPGGNDNPCDGVGGDPVYGSGACPYVVINPAKFDHQGLELFSLFPLPTTTGLFNNFTSSPTKTQDSKTFDIRIDHHFSDKNSFFGRYSFNDLHVVTPDAFPAVVIDTATGLPAASGGAGVLVYPSAPGSAANQGNNAFAGPNFERQQGVGLSFVHVFSPTLIVNLKAGYLRSSIRSFGPNTGSGVSNKLGFPCNAVSCMNLPSNLPGSVQTSGLVGINFAADAPGGDVTTSSYTGLGDVSALPLLEFDNSFQYAGTVTLDKGAHSIKLGLGVIRRRASIDQSMAAVGEIFFDGYYTGEPGGDLLTGLALGNNDPQDGWRSVSLVDQGLRSWEPSIYIQDDWRARHWLTLNLGVRYDIFTPYTEVQGRFSNYNQSLGLIVSPSFPGVQHATPTDGVQTNYRNIAPRIGFAATVPHNMVVRGGFGMSFFPTNYGSGYSGKNPPYNYIAICQTQVNAPGGGATPPCVAPFASNVVANYGVPPCEPGSGPAGPVPCPAGTAANGSSFVGETGGPQFSAGLPVPTVNIAVVTPPAGCNTPSANPNSAACTTPLSPVNPNGNPYVGESLGNLIPFHFPTAYLEQFNLMVQKEVGAGNVITVGYVGELGHHLSRAVNINSFSNPTQTQLPLTAQFPWLNSASLREQEDISNSAYGALQAMFVRRFSKGLTVNFNYTWAHAMGNSSSCTPTPGNPCFYDNVATPASPFVVSSLTKGFSWGNSGQDVKNRFAWAIDYEVPFGKSLTGVEGAILKGWTLNTAGSWQSGLTFSVSESKNLTKVSGARSNPDQTCSGALSSHTLFEWWNPTCFKPQTSGTFGNEHAGQLYGPPTRDMDASVFKEFHLMEALKMQFRVEIFNLFNTPNFGQPSARVSFTGAGVGKAPSTSEISALNQGTNPREVQLALKFLF